VAVYDLERFTVFLVEDNAYVRGILQDLLRSLGVGRVPVAANGAEAIDYLKTVAQAQKAGGVGMGIDLVIADLVMAPINGLLLVRWLRTAKESPNRFMPFIMLSGAADRDYVRAARDLGANEFLAKPFSAAGVYQHILQVIDHPRQFVMTHGFFGPDRRRHDAGPPKDVDGGRERRLTAEADVTVVYSADKVAKPKDDTGVWYFRLLNRLKEKAGGVGATGPGELPAGLLEEAEKKLARRRLDFTEWAVNYLTQLSRLCDEALKRPGAGRRGHFEKINLLAHELRGQGGTFGYPLVSAFAKMLYDVTGEGCRDDDDAVEIVKAHIDAMRAVIRDKVAGDGGQVGKELFKALKQAIDRRSRVG
jgi:CheY-like chemotaxis protein